jgi:hypothetical protein
MLLILILPFKYQELKLKTEIKTVTNHIHSVIHVTLMVNMFLNTRKLNIASDLYLFMTLS